MEYLGHDTTTVHGTIHYGGQWPDNQYRGTDYETADTAFHRDFHTFALEWEEGKLRWYVDGELFQSLGTGMWYSSSAAFPAPFNRDFHLLINLAVGGNWPGSPDGSTVFPQDFVVDGHAQRFIESAKLSQDMPRNQTGVEGNEVVGQEASGNVTAMAPGPWGGYFNALTVHELDISENDTRRSVTIKGIQLG